MAEEVGMTHGILLVDDEANVLQGYQRVMKKSFDLEVALGGPEALAVLERCGPFAVLVADMRMPGMSGLDLLAEVRARFPDTTRIMLTGNSDQKTAMDAVNHGQVFRFLAKPCPPEELELALLAGIRQHQLVVAEKELLEQTLTGAVNLFSELLASVDPVLFSRSQVVRARSAALARLLGCDQAWEVEIAALLAPIGRITLPPGAIQAAEGRAGVDALLAAMPEVGARLLQPIPRMAGVARMIRYQAKGYDGSGLPADEVLGEAIPLGARILKVLWDFSGLEEARKNRTVALEELKLRPRAYDPKVLAALAEWLAASRPVAFARSLRLRELRTGMVLAEAIRAADGGLVLPTGLRLGPGHLELLASLARLLELQEPVAILVSEEAPHEA
jgi:response regulator RpfG family c-di-GMP phosphodiesterase